MKSVLISIQPKWVEKIANGKKTIEVRKTKPNLQTPFKCYIYCTKPKELFDLSYDVSFGKVIGEFICKGIMQPNVRLRLMAKESCLTENELFVYSNGKTLYGWRIADLKIYDKPKELSEFKFAEYHYGKIHLPSRNITRPPQSWCYVEEK